MNRKLLTVFALTVWLLSAFAQNPDVKLRGLVFLDKNKNGLKDQGEKGIKGVPVSNGDTIVLSGGTGLFSISATPGNSIFPILPSGFRISNSPVQNARFFSVPGGQHPAQPVCFPLTKDLQTDHFKIGAVGDLQVSDQEEVSYACQTVIPELSDRKDLHFNIFLGDLVNERMDLLKDVSVMLSGLPRNTWTVFGNHDRDVHATNQDSTFNAFFGATHYAFNYGKVHFIVLNNICSDGGRQYEGRLSDRQLRFIQNDLSLVPSNRLVVICQHIPLVHLKNKDQLIALLQNRKQVLALSGHTHQVSRHFPAQNVTELVAGASCGNWWLGEKDWQGIPSALMQCGSPRNYFVIEFKGAEFQFSFKGIGLDESRQMDILVNGPDTIDHEADGLNGMEEHAVVANIYGGSDSTMVRMQVNEGRWTEMKKASLISPNVSRLIALNKIKAYPTKFSKRAALRKTPSPHIWIGNLPADLQKGIHQIKIEASDRYGFSTSGSRLISF
ncbi:MAG: calcineurin-like phosphoesterase C-terminal domain-containing protein [Prolixibacteraceae bacterium]